MRLLEIERCSGCSSVVERQLPKLNVVGSIPITRFHKSRKNKCLCETYSFALLPPALQNALCSADSTKM